MWGDMSDAIYSQVFYSLACLYSSLVSVVKFQRHFMDQMQPIKYQRIWG